MYPKLGKNKIALITGSTRGIGLSIAKLFDYCGVKVLINSRSKIKKTFLREFKNNPEHYPFDVTSKKKLDNALKKIKKKYKKIDYLICNVGFSSSPKTKQFEIN